MRLVQKVDAEEPFGRAVRRRVSAIELDEEADGDRGLAMPIFVQTRTRSPMACFLNPGQVPSGLPVA